MTDTDNYSHYRQNRRIAPSKIDAAETSLVEVAQRIDFVLDELVDLGTFFTASFTEARKDIRNAYNETMRRIGEQQMAELLTTA